jgi:sugar/nucleoside kinase (ribokinase family)
MSIVVVGSVAYDTVETPRERRERQLGGSASFFAVAARGRGPVRCVGVVGDDFREEDLALLARHADISGIKRVPGKSFHWSGRYHADLIERDTLATELGVFADFQPEIPATGAIRNTCSWPTSTPHCRRACSTSCADRAWSRWIP